MAAEHLALSLRRERLDLLIRVDLALDHDVVVLGALVDGLRLGCRLGKFLGGLLRGGLVDVGHGHDRVDGVEHAVPAAADDALDLAPALAADTTFERLDAAADRAEHRIAVEELRHRGQIAHRADGLHDAQSAEKRRHRVLGRLLGDQFGHADEVVLPVLRRITAGAPRPR